MVCFVVKTSKNRGCEMKDYSDLQEINTIIYKDIESILKRINHRIHFRFYSIMLDNDHKPENINRIKKTISTKIGEKYEYINDSLHEIMQVYKELGLRELELSSIDDPQKLIELSQSCYTVKHDSEKQNKNKISIKQTGFPAQEEDLQDYIQDTQLLYTNTFKVNTGDVPRTVVYLLGIRNVEENVIHMFYNKPELSFLRMVLDYFFIDFFRENVLALDSADQLVRKYQEDAIQFLRRMSRLFFGKMQYFLQPNKENNWRTETLNELRNEYYINNLLEKVDDISTKTYEGASPFGSILFLDKSVLEGKESPVNFAIKFKSDDLISMEDAKRIRKLLELTNVDKHLYLISDCKFIYGLAEVKWNNLQDVFAFRIDFKGLSKYNLIFINIETAPLSKGKLVIEKDRSIYRSNHDLNIVNEILVALTFKNPKLGEEGYTSERMISILRQQFWIEESSNQLESNINNLEQVISMAREQKHGTMVVITDPVTAEKELFKLRKQSTLIEPMEVNPEYIKFLTAIDGAIYFDTNGECRAIGVILDGIAQERQGDASRGARFNSAYRYYTKLEMDDKKCVIVIISEDGMIDIIPPMDDEEKVLNLIEEIIDFLDEEHEEFDTLLLEKENELSKLRITDCHLLFSLARKLYSKDKYEKARIYYEKAFEVAQSAFLPAKYYNWKGLSYAKLENYEEALKIFEKSIEIDKKHNSLYYGNAGAASRILGCELKNKEDKRKMLLKSLSFYDQAISYWHDEEISNRVAKWHNDKGVAYYHLISVISDKEEITRLRMEEQKEYTIALDLDPLNLYYSNRALSYKKMNNKVDAVKDYIQAYILQPDKEVFNIIQELLMEGTESLVIAEFYRDLILNGSSKGDDELEALITKFEAEAQINDGEAAPTDE